MQTTLGGPGSHRDIVCYSWHWQRGAIVLDIDRVVQTWDAQADVQAALGGYGMCVPHPALRYWQWRPATTHSGGPDTRISTIGRAESASADFKLEFGDVMCPPDVATPGLQLPSRLLRGHRAGPQVESGRPWARAGPVHMSKDTNTASGARGASQGLFVVPWCHVALHLHLPRTYHLTMWASSLGVFPGATSTFVEAVHGEGELASPIPLVLCMASAMMDTLLVRYMEVARFQLSLCPLLQAPMADGAPRRKVRLSPLQVSCDGTASLRGFSGDHNHGDGTGTDTVTDDGDTGREHCSPGEFAASRSTASRTDDDSGSSYCCTTRRCTRILCCCCCCCYCYWCWC